MDVNPVLSGNLGAVEWTRARKGAGNRAARFWGRTEAEREGK